MKIALFNVKYSSNLGDGVIADCLEQQIARRLHCEVFSIDLAGRMQWSDPAGGGARVLLLRFLQWLPRWISDAGVASVLSRRVRKRLRPRWAQLLDGVDVAVFGGGQLLQDVNLNFPLKIAAAARECERKELPMAVFAVGASPIQSVLGRSLLKRLLGSPYLFYTAMRDRVSRDALDSMGCQVELCRDPGLLAARVWPAATPPPRVRPLVGLCITHPVVLAQHTRRRVSISNADADALYENIVSGLVKVGFDVYCFTNGAAEDERFLAASKSHLVAADPLGKSVKFAPRCKTPRELAQLIAGCDAVVSHRLHASILAYSYRVPAIGLLWDKKVSSFFESVGRSEFAVPFDRNNAEKICASVCKAIAHGIDPDEHARVLSETVRDIDCLVEAITVHVQPPTVKSDQTPRRQPRAEVGTSGYCNIVNEDDVGGRGAA